MTHDLFSKRLAIETEPINRAINTGLDSVPALCRPVAAHLLTAGGKRLRPLLTVLCARAFGYGEEDIYRLAASMEMLHAATLLHDDVLDSAATRRGKPAAHIIFDPKSAILAGDALLAAGNAIVASFGMPSLSLCYSKATSETANGEILEMEHMGSPELSMEEYLEIAKGKTGCLISHACEMGVILANGSVDAASAASIYGENLGIAFQIVDDALDFAPEEQTGKPSGGDLREGKMTPPLILYRLGLGEEERRQFDSMFSGGIDRAREHNIAQAVLPYIPRAIAVAEECLERARAALSGFPQSGEREILLQMMDYVRSRRS